MSTEKYPEHKKRILLLSDRISQGSVKGIMDSILERYGENYTEKEYITKIINSLIYELKEVSTLCHPEKDNPMFELSINDIIFGLKTKNVLGKS